MLVMWLYWLVRRPPSCMVMVAPDTGWGEWCVCTNEFHWTVPDDRRRGDTR